MEPRNYIGQLGDGLQAERQRRSENKKYGSHELSVGSQNHLELDHRSQSLVEGGAEEEIPYRNLR